MKQRWTVRTYLWSLALAVALPCAAILAYSIDSDARHDARQVRATTLSLAQMMASQTQQIIADAENILDRLSKRGTIRALDASRRPAIFDTFLTLHSHYANLVLCDSTGAVVHSAAPIPRDKVLSDIRAQWVTNVLHNARFTVGKPILGQISQRWVCVLAEPVRNTNGQLAGAIGMSVYLERFQTPSKLVSLPTGSVIAVVDQNGIVMGRSLNSQQWVGKPGRGAQIVDYVLSHTEGSTIARGLDGVERNYSFTTIPTVGWHVYVGIPTASTFASVRANVWRSSLLGALVLGIMIGLVLLLGSRISKELQDYIDSMSTMNAKVALDGSLCIVNKAAQQGSGLPLDELMKTNFLEGKWWAFDSDVQQRVRAAFAKACAGEAINYDEKIFVFGNVMDINFSLVPVRGRDGKVAFIVAEGRDISRLKQAEAALAERTHQLEAANQELEAFSYSVSHDLRAPLRGIEGFAGALAEDYGPKLDEQCHSYLQRIRQGVKRMGELIEGLLNLSRISRAELRRAPVNLSALASDLAAELKESAPDRDGHFHIQPGLTVHGDHQLLQVALNNLLGNAWKFTAKQPAALIEFGKTHINGGHAFFVRDNGAGFDMAYLDKLFKVFQRLHSSHEFDGTGIGLATVQRIIRRHGGRVWCEGKVGEGATFYFTLPG